MLETISSLVRSVTIIVLTAGFLEMLLPSGEIKRFVKAILGLFILVSILNPILGLFDKNVVSEVLAWQDPVQGTSFNTIMVQGEEMSREMNEEAVEMYGKNLAKQIETVVKLVKGVAWVEADVKMGKNQTNPGYETIDSVVLTVGTADKEEEKEGIKEVEPIEVDISGPEKKFKEDPAQEEIKAQIAETLKNFYNFREDQMDIRMISRDEEGRKVE